MLPFWIFKHEKRLKKYEKSKDNRRELTKDFKLIVKRLQEECDKGIIDEYTKQMIIDMTKKVVRNLLGDKYPEVRKEVENMIGGKVLDFEAKRIKDQAIKEGLEEGRAEAYKAGLVSLINILTSILPDFDAVYDKIVSDEKYKDIKREEVMQYYQGN